MTKSQLERYFEALKKNELARKNKSIFEMQKSRSLIYELPKLKKDFDKKMKYFLAEQRVERQEERKINRVVSKKFLDNQKEKRHNFKKNMEASLKKNIDNLRPLETAERYQEIRREALASMSHEAFSKALRQGDEKRNKEQKEQRDKQQKEQRSQREKRIQRQKREITKRQRREREKERRSNGKVSKKTIQKQMRERTTFTDNTQKEIKKDFKKERRSSAIEKDYRTMMREVARGKDFEQSFFNMMEKRHQRYKQNLIDKETQKRRDKNKDKPLTPLEKARQMQSRKTSKDEIIARARSLNKTKEKKKEQDSIELER